jgi:hypothetical protein
MTTELPPFLRADDSPLTEKQEALIKHEVKVPPGNRTALIELEKQSFGIAFEQALEAIADGRSLSEFCSTYHMPVSASRFRTWMFQDPRRKELYHMAKSLGAETVEDDLIRIADGLNPDGSASMNDTNRSKIQIDTRWRLLQVWNRKRYGDVKHIEQTTTTTVDINTLSKHELEQQLLRSLGLDMMDITPDGDTFDNVD